LKASASVFLNRLLARGKFRHVQVLLKLAELGSLQRTADAIGMTQPSVTQTLAYLERLLEIQLFERHARGVRPTSACRDLLPMARHLLLGLAEGAEVLAARQERGQGMVRLAASVAAMHGLLVDALPRFGDSNPVIKVHLTEAEGDDQLLAVARGEVDLVACRRPPVIPQGWHFDPLLEDRLAVLCSADHAVAGLRRVNWKDLAAYPWLLSPAGTAARGRFDQLAASFPHPPSTHAVITRSPTMTWWLLQHQKVLALLPLNFARPLIDAGSVREVLVHPASPMEPLGLLRQAAGEPEATARLGEYLKRYFASTDHRGRGSRAR
jgi:DNA-binding transcriptional LysR family regulator